MKRQSFYWSWSDAQELAPDPAMNRERAARLLRQWRASPNLTVTRIAPGYFKVASGVTRATMVLMRR